MSPFQLLYAHMQDVMWAVVIYLGLCVCVYACMCVCVREREGECGLNKKWIRFGNAYLPTVPELAGLSRKMRCRPAVPETMQNVLQF